VGGGERTRSGTSRKFFGLEPIIEKLGDLPLEGVTFGPAVLALRFFAKLI